MIINQTLGFACVLHLYTITEKEAFGSAVEKRKSLMDALSQNCFLQPLPLSKPNYQLKVSVPRHVAGKRRLGA